jgi:hypothetical protein
MYIFITRLAHKIPKDNDDEGESGIRSNLKDMLRYWEGQKAKEL